VRDESDIIHKISLSLFIFLLLPRAASLLAALTGAEYTRSDDKTFSFFFLLSVSFNRKRRERSHQSINQSNQKGRVVVIRKKNIKIKITYTSQQTRHKQICVDE
jgi:hypothetical protein